MRKILLAIALVVGAAGAVHAQPFCPGVTPWVFDDVQASDPFCGFVTWMAQNNVTLGCQVIDANHRLYCPDDFVTRKQMAGFMKRQADAVMPLTCAAGQVMKWNGLAWACANDDVGSGGGGTVTSVGTGTGLTGGPITTSGTINLLPGYQLPQGCTNGQVAKSTGADAWTCQLDANSGGTVTSVNPGLGLSGTPITTIGTLSVDTSYVQRRISASCPPNQSIRAIGADGSVTCETDDVSGVGAFVQNGNSFGADGVLGTTDNFALNIVVGNQRVMRYEPYTISPNTIGGHVVNFITPGVRGATIAGGGSPTGNSDPDIGFEGPNMVTDHYGTIGGGFNNRAGNNGGPLTDGMLATVGGGFGNAAHGFASTVAGGDVSQAIGHWATVGGGINNAANGQSSTVGGGAANTSGGFGSTAAGGVSVTASGNWSAVGGGDANTASASYATVPGGRLNTASGIDSFAAGRRANALHDGSLAWADSSDFDFNSAVVNEFAARTTGGVRFVLAIDGAGAPTFTCSLPAGGGSWACSSDRRLKQNLVKLDGQTVLAQLRAMPIYAWNPKGQYAHIRHFGPTAQDFHAAFGLGSSTLRIEQQDADGVALAAIQGVDEKLEAREAALRREIEAKTAEVDELKRQIAELRSAQKSEIAELRRAVEILMARTAAEGKLARSH